MGPTFDWGQTAVNREVTSPGIHGRRWRPAVNAKKTTPGGGKDSFRGLATIACLDGRADAYTFKLRTVVQVGKCIKWDYLGATDWRICIFRGAIQELPWKIRIRHSSLRVFQGRRYASASTDKGAELGCS